MKAVKIIIEPAAGWHIRNPATYRVERTYPIIPPTTLFGIVQNLFNTSAHRTRFRDIIALGGYPTSKIFLSVEIQKIIKMYTRKGKTGRYQHVQDRHEIEVAHSKEIESYLLMPDHLFDECFSLLSNAIGDVILLSTNQFPALIKQVSKHEIRKEKNDTLLISLFREGMGFPHVIPMRYEFGNNTNYRAQKYEKVLLPFSPISSDQYLIKDDVKLNKKIDTIRIENARFDSQILELKLCTNKWDRSIEPLIGTS